MGQTLYLECYSGISGDMTVGALLDLGADAEVLKRAIYSLPLHGFEIEIDRVKKAGLDACDFKVKLDAEHENNDHNMEYLYGHRHGYPGEYEYGYCQEHSHKHGEHNHHHSHEHRGLPEILEIIDKAEISNRAKETAGRIFGVLAQAEAKAHGVPAEQVHFHEVGAVDSIIDIIAAAVCLDNLDITEVIVPCLCEGRGTVRCQHGILPIPVPAAANIIQEHHLPLQIIPVERELVTPTGAAIAAVIRTSAVLPEQFEIKGIGIGAGKRNYERSGLLRAMLIEELDGNKSESDIIYKLETNIDDSTGEVFGYIMDKLMEAGARDVHYTPVFMKKNRPAYLLTVICDKVRIKPLEEIIFKETTTIGIRRIKMERTVLKRECEVLKMEYGEIKVKKCTLPDGEVRYYPEYDSVAELAEKKGISFRQVWNACIGEC